MVSSCSQAVVNTRLVCSPFVVWSLSERDLPCRAGRKEQGAQAAATTTATKTSLAENKHLGNSDYFVIIASSSHPSLLTEHAANGLVEAPLK